MSALNRNNRNHRRLFMHVLLRNLFRDVVSPGLNLSVSQKLDGSSHRFGRTHASSLIKLLFNCCSLHWPMTSEDWWPSSFGLSRGTSRSLFFGSDQQPAHSPPALWLYNSLAGNHVIQTLHYLHTILQCERVHTAKFIISVVWIWTSPTGSQTEMTGRGTYGITVQKQELYLN